MANRRRVRGRRPFAPPSLAPCRGIEPGRTARRAGRVRGSVGRAARGNGSWRHGRAGADTAGTPARRSGRTRPPLAWKGHMVGPSVESARRRAAECLESTHGCLLLVLGIRVLVALVKFTRRGEDAGSGRDGSPGPANSFAGADLTATTSSARGAASSRRARTRGRPRGPCSRRRSARAGKPRAGPRTSSARGCPRSARTGSPP